MRASVLTADYTALDPIARLIAKHEQGSLLNAVFMRHELGRHEGEERSVRNGFSSILPNPILPL